MPEFNILTKQNNITCQNDEHRPLQVPTEGGPIIEPARRVEKMENTEFENYWTQFATEVTKREHTLKEMHDMMLRAYPKEDEPNGWIVWHKSVAEDELKENDEIREYYERYYGKQHFMPER